MLHIYKCALLQIKIFHFFHNYLVFIISRASLPIYVTYLLIYLDICIGSRCRFSLFTWLYHLVIAGFMHVFVELIDLDFMLPFISTHPGRRVDKTLNQVKLWTPFWVPCIHCLTINNSMKTIFFHLIFLLDKKKTCTKSGAPSHSFIPSLFIVIILALSTLSIYWYDCKIGAMQTW